ncbi:N-6 DNA methylase [Streptomyces shenzhenensis]|uniref:N-6 DNA methylase n=1 Tax=Streptomyces shenzhenensis TaxID=943815 RepID=UPI001F272455|nr:N-6 DNA methylase [Streptomyces shenzhenensis]
MPQPSAQVTAAEISRIAGVTRATVSNWRRRHDDFPAPAGGNESSPLYDLESVRAWLRSRGQASAAAPAEELRTLLRLHPVGTGPAAPLLPLVLATSRRSPGELTELAGLPDTDLAAHADAAVADLTGTLPQTGAAPFTAADAAVVRALIHCVREEGAQAAVDVLAERELEDSASTGTYQTPDRLADLMARLLPADTARVLDPACGSGTLLAAAARHGARELYGQDALPVQAQRSAVRLLLATPDAAVAVQAGDSLRHDAFPQPPVDAVLCNPPYGDRDWGHDELAYDPRWAYGVPPRSEPELAWIQHALAHLRPGGYAVLLLPPATAARASGRRVRAELVRGGALRAVVALPSGAAAPLHIGLQLWILRTPEPDGPDRASVLFVDADGERQQDRSRNRSDSTPGSTGTRRRRDTLDWDELTATVLDHWTTFRADPESFSDEPGIARAVPVLDLLDEVVDLTPARQVRALPADIDPAQVSRQADDHRERLTEHTGLLAQAAQGTWRPTGDSPRQWRTATLSDLARGGALEILRAATDTREKTEGAHWRAENSGRRVLLGADIADGVPASGTFLDSVPLKSSPVIAEGDILVRVFTGDGGNMARPADEQDIGALLGHDLYLLRPDPARLDPWFLAGFVGAHDNITGASTGSTTVHLQPGRLRVPLLPLQEQRRYGEAFRRVHELNTAARRATDLARAYADLLTTGLTAGALLPPETASA